MANRRCTGIAHLTLSLGPRYFREERAAYAAALPLGLAPSVNILLALVLIVPVSLFFISLGLLFGSILNVKQVGGICGSLLTNLSAWLSGIWFDIALLGNVFGHIANALPFVHAVEMERAAIAGNFGDILPHLLWVLGYTAAAAIAAVLLFLRQMKKQ